MTDERASLRAKLERERRLWGVLLALDLLFVGACVWAFGRRVFRVSARGAGLPATQAQPEEPTTTAETAKAHPAMPLEARPAPDMERGAKVVPIELEWKGKAKKVEVTAGFLGWKKKPLKRKGDAWRVRLFVKPGTYRYRFVVDGRERPDPRNPKREGDDSLVTVP